MSPLENILQQFEQERNNGVDERRKKREDENRDRVIEQNYYVNSYAKNKRSWSDKLKQQEKEGRSPIKDSGKNVFNGLVDGKQNMHMRFKSNYFEKLGFSDRNKFRNNYSHKKSMDKKLTLEIIMLNNTNEHNNSTQYETNKNNNNINKSSSNGKNVNKNGKINKGSNPMMAINNYCRTNNQLQRAVKNRTHLQINRLIQPQHFVNKNADLRILEQNLNQNIFKKKDQAIEHYQIINDLGSGSYAQVKLGINKNNNQKVAIKIYQKTNLQSKQRKQNLEREIQILKVLDHPNIIKLVEQLEDDDNVYLVMEYISKISLFQYLRNQTTNKLSLQQIRNIWGQLVKAIQYLHSLDIVHRDIKLENIMINEYFIKNKRLDDSDIEIVYQVKLIDFGFSLKTDMNSRLTMLCGTPCYMAPEIISCREYEGKPTDVWSLGIILYILVVGRFPFRSSNKNKVSNDHDQELYQKILEGVVNYPESMDWDCRTLLARILDPSVHSRIDARTILQHKFMLNNNI